MEPTVIIEAGSEAFNYLKAVFAEPKTYKVSIDARPDGVAVKWNETVWTHTMDITAAGRG